jgi:ferredoxin, 2Fe-2S
MMPQISFVKNKPALEVNRGTNLMRALLDANIPVASSCHGDGVCCKCVITVVQGIENLSPRNQVELELMERNPLPPEKRVSCQTLVLGDIQIDAGYW